MEDKAKINPDGPKKEDIPPINPTEDEKPHVGPRHLKVPHIGKKPVKKFDLFSTGPFRGGSLGRSRKNR